MHSHHIISYHLTWNNLTGRERDSVLNMNWFYWSTRNKMARLHSIRETTANLPHYWQLMIQFLSSSVTIGDVPGICLSLDDSSFTVAGLYLRNSQTCHWHDSELALSVIHWWLKMHLFSKNCSAQWQLLLECPTNVHIPLLTITHYTGEIYVVTHGCCKRSVMVGSPDLIAAELNVSSNTDPENTHRHNVHNVHIRSILWHSGTEQALYNIQPYLWLAIRKLYAQYK